MTLEETRAELAGVDGVLVPGGFGSRGWEGKILACRVAREDEFPTSASVSACMSPSPSSRGMSCGLDGANSTEMDPETPFPVIDLLPEQKEVEDLGGTMRLGAQGCRAWRTAPAHARSTAPARSPSATATGTR